MSFRAYGPLTRSTRHRMPQMPGMRMIGTSPGDVRRSKERHDWRSESRGHMARSRVGRNQKPRPADARLRRPDSQLLVGQAHDSGVVGALRDLASRFALSGPAQDENTIRLGL